MPILQKDFYLRPITEFVDRAPKEMIDKIQPSANKDVKVTVSILSCLHVTTIQSFGAISRDISNENAKRETSLVLLQLVNALKSLQARGIEDANGSLNDIILCRENVSYSLYLLQESEIKYRPER
ncbi:uncharacterized protein LOC126855697 [Cataglyphis hispanica]|uniref:uncharacterized protein LOC126855697 n=1 Tax=Cataglyphis hispanica TaxID=1086592 RepID=UPI0021800FEC|nr:uncharacterized protein LOC126855697 [Cataglyphis hispanica]